MRPSVDIVIPVHNEVGFLPGALGRLLDEISGIDADIAVILAENGSTDGTGELAERLAAKEVRVRVLRLPKPDYGAAMRAGFTNAGAAWVVNFDIDYYSADFLRSALALAGEADIVLASKRAPGADDQRGLVRRMGTFGFNRLLRAMFGSKVSDTHGMKMIRRDLVTRIAPTVISNQDLFDTELVIRAERAGARIAEVPAIVEELREARSSFLGRVPRTIKGLWRIRRALRSEARSGR
ncbi:MAG TPA: glycosyltransferase family 2 protein [Acidimicrobiia bacterium]|nr:glycosyltransferase family 2 protein [Acidimicrobiia bacterium]